MTHPSKVKGDRAERELVNYLAPYFPNVRRGKAGGEADLGDIFGVVDRDRDAWTLQVADRNWRAYGEIEAKACEAAAQSERAGTYWWALIVKRVGKADPGEWFVYLPWWALHRCVTSRPNWPKPSDSRGARVLAEEADQYGELDLAHLTVRAWLALVAPTVADPS